VPAEHQQSVVNFLPACLIRGTKTQGLDSRSATWPQLLPPWSWGRCRAPHGRHQDAPGLSSVSPRITQFAGEFAERGMLGLGRGSMCEDASSKAERYRKAANKYGEMAKQAEPSYLAEVYRKIAVRYVFMAEEELRWAERRREDVSGSQLAKRPVTG
jgi:hypothetical protein